MELDILKMNRKRAKEQGEYDDKQMPQGTNMLCVSHYAIYISMYCCESFLLPAMDGPYHAIFFAIKYEILDACIHITNLTFAQFIKLIDSLDFM